MPLQCLILDLDNTLIDTSSISAYRDTGQWKEAYDGIEKCALFPNTEKLIKAAKNAGLKIAIATNSPSTYANKLLRHFKINVDYLVAFHDVRNHKPSPDCLNRILEHFKLPPTEVLYLGDSSDDQLCAANANVEFFAVDWANLNEIDSNRIGIEKLLEYISEAIYSSRAEYSKNVIQQGNRYFLGYYVDQIKKEIWNFKDAQTGAVKRWVNYATSLSDELPKVDFVVRALGHDEFRSENQEIPLDILSKSLSSALGATYIPQLITKTRVLEKSTGLNASMRSAQVHGAYEIDRSFLDQIDLSGKSILIVDDVLTSGATTNEISRVIGNASQNVVINIFTLVKTIYRETHESLFQQSTDLFYSLYNPRKLQPLSGNVDPNPENAPESIKQRKLKNRLFTANYSNTNHNFIIQNIDSYSIASEPKSKYLFSALQVLRNILQRGTPTIPSRLLRETLSITETDRKKEVTHALISKKPIKWARQIRGDTSQERYPARHFFDVLLPKYLGDLSFIRQLMVPEVKIYEMTQTYVAGLFNKQVDFYIPQIGLIIEVDGAQHSNMQELDQRRDDFTASMGLTTIRFSSREIYDECEDFQGKMGFFLNAINRHISLENNGTLTIPNGIKLSDYQAAFDEGVDVSHYTIVLSAIMRFQLLLLELLESGRIRLGAPTTLYLINRDGIKNFAKYALEDLDLMLGHELTLLGQSVSPIEVKIIEINGEKPLATDAQIVIDFSVLERFSDEFQIKRDVTFVRTDYFDFYRVIEQGSSHNMRAESLRKYDYFEMSCAEPIKYNLDLSPGSGHRSSLLYFLSNLFLPFESDVDFREGQIGIIGSALSRLGTIGLLPTGSGKSICYQLAALLQPAISFVVCPIKSLMYDQKTDLDTIGITRSDYITSDQTASEKAQTQKAFGSGKYFFVFISPERFQTKAFRSEMRAIGLDFSFAFAVIDEVHCLSEWGHDFRTSYLNLSNTINKFAPSATYIGLTATASVNVLKDIQTEFDIPTENVRTPLEFTRSELRFDVIDDRGKKADVILSTISKLDEKWNGNLVDSQRRAGIIFTPTVNGVNGCYALASRLATSLKKDVRYYSGSAPVSANFHNETFEQYKRNVQNDFKSNKYDFLAATKAFGMGVNKGNIAFTVHYGIPGSMEALYQEAGRAGRNKKLFSEVPADCFVLLTREKNEAALNKLWDATITVEQLKAIQKELTRGSDVGTNLWLMTNSLDSINDEYKLMCSVYSFLTVNSEEPLKLIQANHFGTDKSKLEKVVYRLCQLGIVKDWTIEDFFRGKIEVETSILSDKEIGSNLENTIRKYESDFDLEKFDGEKNEFYEVIWARRKAEKITQVQFVFLILLIWSYDHFVYNRRQSLKTVYEQCSDLASRTINNKEFKERLEGYFKFNVSSQSFLHLAENTTSTRIWLDSFFEEDARSATQHLVSMSKALELKNQLARFLESYKDNVSLNYLSGILRLITEQFDDADGERRMASSFSRISKFDYQEIDFLVTSTIRLAPLFSGDAKARFAEIFYKYIPNDELLEKVNEGFHDEFSYRILLGKIDGRLITFMNNLKETNWWQISNN